MDSDKKYPRPQNGPPPTNIQPFVDLVAALRAPGGCPWDRAQNHQTLAPYAIEETYELIDSIEADDDDSIREELGDLLLQVVLHAQLASERGAFELQDVIRGISDKMIRRHPHVFGDEEAEHPDTVEARWKAAKRAEGRTALGGVPRSMPTLQRGLRLTQRAASVGFDWPDVEGASRKLDEELAELRAVIALGDEDAIEDELGDLLFCVVNLARKLGLDPERALRRTLLKFERRFAYIEARLAEDGRTAEESTLDEMDALWDEAKAAGEPEEL